MSDSRKASTQRTDVAAAGFRPARASAASPADDLARSVRRHWKLVAITALAVTLLGWLLAAVQPRRYRTTAIAAVAPVVEGMAPADLMRGVDTLDRRVVVATVAALAATPVVHKGAQAGDGYEIEATVQPNTALFNINVEGPDARETAAIANRVPALLAQQTRSMYKLYQVTPISPAAVPTQAALPRPARAVMAGLVFGVLLGVGAAWLLDRGRRGATAQRASEPALT